MQLENDMESKGHITEFKTFVLIWLLLILGLGLTVLLSTVDLGYLNVWAALLIAAGKSSLVLFFFMNLRYEQKVIKYMILLTIGMMTLFISLIFFDVSFR